MSKSMMRSALVVAMLIAALVPSVGQAAQPSAREQEAKLIAVLKSGAQLKEKAGACRELALVGTSDAVPALAALLGDPKLSHMARYALEPIPGPAVDEALRDALGRLKGRPLVGVIGSIGVRRDARATDALGRLLGNAGAEVAQGAALAMGKIGTAAAAEALEGALPKAPKANRLALCQGLFRCAEALAASGQRDKATEIYDRLRAVKQVPHQVRTGALRGAVLTRGTAGVPLLLEAIRGDDFVLVGAAARTAMELPGAEVAKALADELGKLPADKQILVTQVLGNRGDAGAVPALCALARKGDSNARVAAIRALPEIGDARATEALVGLVGDPDGSVASAAQNALAALAGPKIDAALTAMLTQPDVATRRAAIEMLGQRRVATAMPALLKAAGDADESVRIASTKVLGDLAGAEQFPAMVGLLMKARSSGGIKAAESALAATCTRLALPVPGSVVIRKAVYGAAPKGGSADVTKKVAAMVKAGAVSVDASNANFGDPARGIVKALTIEYTVNGVLETKTVGENQTVTLTVGVVPKACTDALCAALPQAPTKPKLALLRVLRSVRGPRALAAVRAATTDANADVRNGAVSLLCNWPTVEALPDVLRLAKTSTDRRVKILALRGCLRLIPMQQVPVQEKLASLKDVLALIERDEEKKLALAALAATPTVEALALVTPHLGNPALKEEASLAAVAIAEKVIGRHPAQVAEAMEQVAKATRNKPTAKRARALLGRAKKAAPRK